MSPNKETSKNVQYYKHSSTFDLESGKTLAELEIAYHTYGTLNDARDNVVWVFHAFTANSEVANWWEGMVASGKLLDPANYFIVCANMLGSCYGTTGPMSINPDTGKTYRADFPLVTMRDMIGVHQILKSHLGIDKIRLGIGGSMGGQQGIEWTIMEPNLFDKMILIASNLKHSAWAIAFNNAQRLAIQADTSKDKITGLTAARAIAMISYRNHIIFNKTQTDEDHEKIDHYKVEAYQAYQGKKLIDRFDPNAYITLSKAMDSHDIFRGRKGDAKNILGKVRTKILMIGISSDILFPVEEQKEIATQAPNASFAEIDSFYGHDGFLVEVNSISKLSEAFLNS